VRRAVKNVIIGVAGSVLILFLAVTVIELLCKYIGWLHHYLR
jgi:hypothetical protein